MNLTKFNMADIVSRALAASETWMVGAMDEERHTVAGERVPAGPEPTVVLAGLAVRAGDTRASAILRASLSNAQSTAEYFVGDLDVCISRNRPKSEMDSITLLRGGVQ